MKQFIVGSLMVLASAFMFSACAIGKLEDAADQLEEVKEKIGDLAVAECMKECSDDARACFEEANQGCIDSCEVNHDACELQEETCTDAAREACKPYSDYYYDSCMDQYDDVCDYDCDQKFSDCGQECGNDLKDCLFEAEQQLVYGEDPSFSECFTACVEEMEDTLQEFD